MKRRKLKLIKTIKSKTIKQITKLKLKIKLKKKTISYKWKLKSRQKWKQIHHKLPWIILREIHR
jgi:hypothetical protein